MESTCNVKEVNNHLDFIFNFPVLQSVGALLSIVGARV